MISLENQSSVEKNLIESHKMTQAQIDQIREIFVLMDEDKSGSLSYEEIAKLISRLTQKDTRKEEAMEIIKQMDSNFDGFVEWEEFLNAMYNWLSSLGKLDLFSDSDGNHSQEKRSLHFTLANFFLQFDHDNNIVPDNNIFSVKYEGIEESLESWNFLGSSEYSNDKDKWTHYVNNQKLLENFSIIAQNINSDDLKCQLEAVQNIVELAKIIVTFSTSGERFQIGAHIIKTFELIEKSYCLGKICDLLITSQDPVLIYECLKAITIISAGPRIANTPEDSYLHPKANYFKNLLLQKDIITTLFVISQSVYIEVRRQAVLCLGMLSHSYPDVRVYIIQKNGIDVIRDYISSDLDDNTNRAYGWTLSILAGVSNKVVKTSLETQDEKLLEVFTYYLFNNTDYDTIAYTLMGLSYILPWTTITETNCKLWDALIKLLTSPSILIIRSSLLCLKAIAKYNGDQVFYLFEQNLILFLAELLNHHNDNIKSEVCNILELIAHKGYQNNIVQSHHVISNLSKMMYEDNNLRKCALTLLFALVGSSVQTNYVILNYNLIKTIFSTMSEFKFQDKILKEIYGSAESTYHLDFLIDCFTVLNGFFLNDTSLSQQDANEYFSTLGKQLEDASFDKVQKTVTELFGDIEKGAISQIFLKQYFKDVCIKIDEFFVKSQELYANLPQRVISNEILAFLKLAIPVFQERAKKLMQFIENNSFTASSTIDFDLYPIEEYPNGKYYSLKDIPIDVDLFKLNLEVENIFAKSPLSLSWRDNLNNPYILGKDLTLEMLISKSPKDKLTGAVKIRLVVATVVPTRFSNMLSSTSFSAWGAAPLSGKLKPDVGFLLNNATDLGTVASELNNLSKHLDINTNLVKNIHQTFCEVTSKRYMDKTVGTVNQMEFAEIMKKYMKDDNSTIEKLYNLIQVNGKVDFRDFVCAMAFINGGSFEDKLMLAFTAYDNDRNGFIDKTELSEMIRSSAKWQGLSLSDSNIIDKCKGIFDKYDINNDGTLSFTEFKSMVHDEPRLLSIWNDPEFIKKFSQKPLTYQQNFGVNFNPNQSKNTHKSIFVPYRKKY